MAMKYPKKLQTKRPTKTIICPNCDGRGVDVLHTAEEDIPTACKECGGRGELKVVTNE